MPVQTTYPGIYIEELPNSTHTITAAPTSVTVFVGYTHPFKTKQFNTPVELFSFTDYQRNFGGFFRNEYFDAEAPLFGDVAQAVNQFFLNGGADAWVVGLQAAPLKQARGNLDDFATLAAQEQAGNVSTASPTYSYPNLTVTVGPLSFFPLEPIDSNHQMLVTVSNVQATYPASDFSAPPPSLTIPYSYSLPYSSPLDDTADVTITYGPPPSSPLAGYGNVAETYRQVSAFPYLTRGPGGWIPSATPIIPFKANPNYVLTRINGVSSLVKAVINPPGGVLQPASGCTFPKTLTVPKWQGLSWDPVHSQVSPKGNSPVIFESADFTNVFQQDSALDKLSIFNLLVIPGVTDNGLGSVLSSATAFCEKKLAFLIMDPPIDNSADTTVPWYSTGAILIEDTMAGNTNGETIPPSANSALYFPYLRSNDPVTGLEVNPITTYPYEIPPSGTIAGIYASTDLTRGCWKAPAGLATTLANVSDVAGRGKMTDHRQGVLNPLGINCVRNFPSIGPVVWGARTSIAANPAFQQWTYVPVRRMALFLEQTL